jgi:hypothetical protein
LGGVFDAYGAALTKAAAARRIIPASDSPLLAQVAELADALDSGSSAGNGVEVRILSWAPTFRGPYVVAATRLVPVLVSVAPADVKRLGTPAMSQEINQPETNDAAWA